MKLTEPLACTCGNHITEHELSVDMNIRNSKYQILSKLCGMRILMLQICAVQFTKVFKNFPGI